MKTFLFKASARAALLGLVFVGLTSSFIHAYDAYATQAATAESTQPAVATLTAAPTPTFSPAQIAAAIPEVKGAISPIHDPSMIKAGGKYYLFSTGNGIPMHCSDDLITWAACDRVFFGTPDWLKDAVPGVQDLWAPDISFFNGKYHVYYAASTFGSNHSVIGLVTNVTLDANDPTYKWVDEGLVLASEKGNTFNAIDPNLAFDTDGQAWLAFGSFWDGIKMRKINASTGKLATDDLVLYSLARRTTPPDAIEAAYITHRGSYYYLFVSYDFCCKGVTSDYKIMVGRSTEITGPYIDRDGKSMLAGGATLVYKGSDRWRGPGHNAILVEGDTYWMLYHSYDAKSGGTPTLRIEALQWDSDDWPNSLSALLGQ